MRDRTMTLATAALSLGASAAAAQPAPGYDPKEAEAYIVSSEAQWAASVATGDHNDSAHFVADDFVGVDPDGKLYSKADALSGGGEGPGFFVSNHVNAVKVRFFGDTAVAQGSETWVKRSGDRGRYVWTDTWVRRDGRWRVVAAEDVAAPEPAP